MRLKTKLQVAISQVMRDTPEIADQISKIDETECFDALGDWGVSTSLLSMHAAIAAATSIEQGLEIISSVKDGLQYDNPAPKITTLSSAEYEYNKEPTDATLAQIEGYQGDFNPLMEWIAPIFEGYGRCEQRGEIWQVETGGLSGNELVIMSLKKNRLFWALCWSLSKKGGHYEFEIKETESC